MNPQINYLEYLEANAKKFELRTPEMIQAAFRDTDHNLGHLPERPFELYTFATREGEHVLQPTYHTFEEWDKLVSAAGKALKVQEIAKEFKTALEGMLSGLKR
jgi:hypothetical protein